MTTRIVPLKHPEPETVSRRVFIRDLVLQAEIGVYEHERGRTQPVRISVEMDVSEAARPQNDQLDSVVCYDRLTRHIKGLVARGPVGLAETLAEEILALAFQDVRVLSARVLVEKPDAIADAQSVGVEIIRKRPNA